MEQGRDSYSKPEPRYLNLALHRDSADDPGVSLMCIVELAGHDRRLSDLDCRHFRIHNSAPSLNGAPVPWFTLQRQPRTFEFRARASDGSVHDFEIQASSAKTALDLAKRLCAAKG